MVQAINDKTTTASAEDRKQEPDAGADYERIEDVPMKGPPIPPLPPKDKKEASGNFDVGAKVRVREGFNWTTQVFEVAEKPKPKNGVMMYKLKVPGSDEKYSNGEEVKEDDVKGENE